MTSVYRRACGTDDSTDRVWDALQELPVPLAITYVSQANGDSENRIDCYYSAAYPLAEMYAAEDLLKETLGSGVIVRFEAVRPYGLISLSAKLSKPEILEIISHLPQPARFAVATAHINRIDYGSLHVGIGVTLQLLDDAVFPDAGRSALLNVEGVVDVLYDTAARFVFTTPVTDDDTLIATIRSVAKTLNVMIHPSVRLESAQGIRPMYL
jgi:hypothetical protein